MNRIVVKEKSRRRPGDSLSELLCGITQAAAFTFSNISGRRRVITVVNHD